MTQADPNVERFFIDHGMIHDRITGRHVTTAPDDEIWNGMCITETCALLNSLNTRVEPILHPLPSEIEDIGTAVMRYIRPSLKCEIAFSTLCEAIYTAMQRSTPTAPVQGDDDDALDAWMDRTKAKLAADLPVQGDDAEKRASPLGPHAKLSELIALAALSAASQSGSGYDLNTITAEADRAAKLWEEHCSRLSGDNNAALVEARLRTFVLKLAKFDFPQTGEGSDGKRFAKALREIRRDARNLLDTLGDAK